LKENFRISKILYRKRAYIVLWKLKDWDMKEERRKMGRDEQILVLEEMECLFEKAMEG